MKETAVTFRSGSLALEGRLYRPEGEGPFPGVVVCHPHPLYGGSMDNNVVNALCTALVGESIVALKFNFRGVGNSEGAHDYGKGEQEDVRSAVDFLGDLEEIEEGKIGVAGYSAGASYSLAAVDGESKVAAAAFVSPPLTTSDFSALIDLKKPFFLTIGGRDDITPPGLYRKFCSELTGPHECNIVEEADHQWWGREREMAGKVADFFKRALYGREAA